MDYELFLRDLKELRNKKGMSLREMGMKMGISGQQVSFFERGKTPLRIKDYFTICDILQVSPLALIEKQILTYEHRSIAERLSKLSERDFRIIKDLMILMELSPNDL